MRLTINLEPSVNLINIVAVTCLLLFILGGRAGGGSSGMGLVPLDVIMCTLSSEPLLKNTTKLNQYTVFLLSVYVGLNDRYQSNVKM